ncbi:hypothetical protein EAI_06085 [Harpegnathos saltator]|uniref:Secreted protein n=1 Tax=Harpegnathos saltator TaxID=610380 RepID=E2BAF3_HARSA|nr:hypothetical protein EAI_06085 [Harpegnathos saltator]
MMVDMVVVVVVMMKMFLLGASHPTLSAPRPAAALAKATTANLIPEIRSRTKSHNEASGLLTDESCRSTVQIDLHENAEINRLSALSMIRRSFYHLAMIGTDLAEKGKSILERVTVFPCNSAANKR